MEARDKPQHRTQVNPYAGGFGLGECALLHDARFPTVTETVVGRRRRDIAYPYPRRSPRVRDRALAGPAVELAEATTRREARGEVGSPHMSEEAG